MPSPFAALVLPAAAGFAALVIWASRTSRAALERQYRATAARLGLQCWIPERGFFRSVSPLMSGTLEGRSVSVDEFTRDKQMGVRVTVTPPVGDDGIPLDLSLEPERQSLGIFRREDIIVGDPGFDEKVRIRGSSRGALAALGADARREILAALAASEVVRLADGVVVVEILLMRHRVLDDVITRAARISALLGLPGEAGDPRDPRIVRYREALAARAIGDPEPGVRLRALDELAQVRGWPERTRDVARRLLADPHPEVSQRAAVELGDEGFDMLAALVRSRFQRADGEGKERMWWEIDLGEGRRYELAEALDRSREGHERRRARALDLLVGRFPPSRVRPLLREALERGSIPLRLAALRGIAVAGDPSFEGALLPFLDAAADDEREAAVAALGAAGTVAAVPRLRSLAAASGALAFAARREIEAAVSAIQSRLDGAAAGQVSLAGAVGEEGAGGRLALAGPHAEAGGEVSLSGGPGDPAGRLSPSTEG